MSAEPQTQPWDPRAAVGQRFSVSVVVGAEAETLSTESNLNEIKLALSGTWAEDN